MEKAKTELGRNGALKGKKVAVLGGQKAIEKFVNEGDVTESAQMDHMLTRGVTAALLAGDVGFALAASKQYGHTTEQEAKNGVINLRIGKEEFTTTAELAKFILNKMSKDPNYFQKTNYEGDEERVRSILKQIARGVPKAKDEKKPEGKKEKGGGSSVAPEPPVNTDQVAADNDENNDDDDKSS